MILVLFGMTFAGLSVNDVSLSQDSYKPGTNGVLTMQVSNLLSGGTTVKAVNAVSLELSSSPEILVSGETFIGDIEPGGSTTIAFPFKIKDDAKSSIYLIKIKATGTADRPGTTGGFDTFTRQATVPVVVLDAPILSISSDKQLLSGIEDANLTVTNNGGTASNLRISIQSGSEAAFYGKNEIFIDEVEDSNTTTITFDVRSVADYTIDMPFNLEYEDELGIKRTDNTTLRFTIIDEELDVRFVQKSDLKTREDSTLSLTVYNDGSETIRDVRLSFQDENLKLKNGSEFKFGNLAPDQSASASALVYTELSPGTNLVPSTVEWIEGGVHKSENRNVTVTVLSDADVAVYLEAKPLPLSAGGEHTISVLVSNLGTYSIENVDVSISSPIFKSLDISDKQYIGGLQRDDFSTVQFLMDVNATGEGTYPVYLDINYRDLSGEWKNKKLVEYVTVHNGLQKEDSDPLPLIIGAGVLVILVWWFKFRKK
jgi:hypothetical protein